MFPLNNIIPAITQFGQNVVKGVIPVITSSAPNMAPKTIAAGASYGSATGTVPDPITRGLEIFKEIATGVGEIRQAFDPEPVVASIPASKPIEFTKNDQSPVLILKDGQYIPPSGTDRTTIVTQSEQAQSSDKSDTFRFVLVLAALLGFLGIVYLARK